MENDDILKMARETFPQLMAEEIVSVQPMSQPIDWKAVEQAFAMLYAYRKAHGIHCSFDALHETKSSH